MIDDMEHGTDFYFSEEDYLTPEDLSATSSKKGLKRRYSRASIKIRIAPGSAAQVEQDTSATTLRIAGPSSPQPSSLPTKRPRRSAASSTKQYVVPDSDDDMILDDTDRIVVEANRPSKTRKVETSLQRWVKHLTALLQAEQKKVSLTVYSFPLSDMNLHSDERAEEAASGCHCPRHEDPGRQG